MLVQWSFLKTWILMMLFCSRTLYLPAISLPKWVAYKSYKVVVFGAGQVVIMAAKCAWLFGAGRVIVIDKEEYRLDFVRKYANCKVYNFLSLEDPVRFIKQTADWIGADVCIDTVGEEAA
jgi:threonine dehydrogenase-like Zn-dependent dehydrogenase